jgi:hypothetical protein
LAKNSERTLENATFNKTELILIGEKSPKIFTIEIYRKEKVAP